MISLLAALVALLVLAGTARVQWERAEERRLERQRWERPATWRLSSEVLFMVVALAVGCILYLMDEVMRQQLVPGYLGRHLDSLLFLPLGISLFLQGNRTISGTATRPRETRTSLKITGTLLVLAGIGGLIFR